MFVYNQVMLRKIPTNVPGRFVTTECCIGCDMCRSVAPKNFEALADGSYRVAKQPENEKELAAVLVAYQNTFAPNGPGPCIIDREDLKNRPAEFED